jgi:hypothetical protein
MWLSGSASGKRWIRKCEKFPNSPLPSFPYFYPKLLNSLMKIEGQAWFWRGYSARRNPLRLDGQLTSFEENGNQVLGISAATSLE